MVLISLLLVLSLERAIRKQPVWHVENHLGQYLQWTQGQDWIAKQSVPIQLVLQIALPAVVTFLVCQWLFGGFISFVLQSVILFLCLGSEPLRNTYRSFLQAAERGDLEACHLYTRELGHCTSLEVADEPTQQGKSFGQHLLWLNYQHYAAVIIFFTVFGAAGAIAYVTSRECFRLWCESDDERKKRDGRLDAYSGLVAGTYYRIRIVIGGPLFPRAADLVELPDPSFHSRGKSIN